jgi:hypothetical protein
VAGRGTPRRPRTLTLAFILKVPIDRLGAAIPGRVWNANRITGQVFKSPEGYYTRSVVPGSTVYRNG